MLPCVCSVIDHRGRQNVVRTSMTHSAAPRVPLFCSYHIFTSYVIYYWTDARQHGIYLSSFLSVQLQIFRGICTRCIWRALKTIGWLVSDNSRKSSFHSCSPWEKRKNSPSGFGYQIDFHKIRKQSIANELQSVITERWPILVMTWQRQCLFPSSRR